jgi:hypothetical protein
MEGEMTRLLSRKRGVEPCPDLSNYEHLNVAPGHRDSPRPPTNRGHGNLAVSSKIFLRQARQCDESINDGFEAIFVPFGERRAEFKESRGGHGLLQLLHMLRISSIVGICTLQIISQLNAFQLFVF